MKRPKLEIKLDAADFIIESIGLIGLVILLALPFHYFNQLPEKIPSHFGAGGKPDAYSGKEIIWIFPILGSIIYICLSWLNKYPHKLNYPQEITIQNAPALYSNVTKMMRIIKVLIACTFAYLTYSTIQVAMNHQSGLGKLFLPVFLLLMFGITGYFLFSTSKKITG